MSAPFRIGVDARTFHSPAGGMRRYVWELYGRLPHLEPGVEVIAIGASPDLPLPPELQRRPATDFPTNLGWTALSLPLAIRGAGLDVFHAPAYTAPLWGVHPQVVTIHDVSYERVPEWNAYRNDSARRWFYRRSALAADHVITDSAFSKQEITAAYGIAPGHISVVPLAAAETFTPGAFNPTEVPRGVRQPYVLHVGDLQIRRNLATALAAIVRLRTQGPRTKGPAPERPRSDGPVTEGPGTERPETARPETQGRMTQGPGTEGPLLVLAGVDRGIGARLVEQARAAGDPDALVITGPISEALLLNLYRGAAVLAYPSRYEGFGLPILEAMRCGVPVVAANSSSLPELVGQAGTLLDPLDEAAWAAAIGAILAAPDVPSRRDASLAQAARFSWDRTARETLAVLRACARGGRP